MTSIVVAAWVMTQTVTTISALVPVARIGKVEICALKQVSVTNRTEWISVPKRKEQPK